MVFSALLPSGAAGELVAHNLGVDRGPLRADADQFGLEYVDLTAVEPDHDAAALLEKELAFRYQALPVRFLGDGLLLVTVADPTEAEHAERLRLALGHDVRLAVSEPGELEGASRKLHTQAALKRRGLGEQIDETALATALQEERGIPVRVSRRRGIAAMLRTAN